MLLIILLYVYSPQAQGAPVSKLLLYKPADVTIFWHLSKHQFCIKEQEVDGPFKNKSFMNMPPSNSFPSTSCGTKIVSTTVHFSCRSGYMFHFIFKKTVKNKTLATCRIDPTMNVRRISLTFRRVIIPYPLKGLSYNLLVIYYSPGCDLSTKQNHSSFCYTLCREKNKLIKKNIYIATIITITQGDSEEGSKNKWLLI